MEYEQSEVSESVSLREVEKDGERRGRREREGEGR